VLGDSQTETIAGDPWLIAGPAGTCKRRWRCSAAVGMWSGRLGGWEGAKVTVAGAVPFNLHGSCRSPDGGKRAPEQHGLGSGLLRLLHPVEIWQRAGWCLGPPMVLLTPTVPYMRWLTTILWWVWL
jgi:hypothetical protein